MPVAREGQGTDILGRKA